MKHIVFTSLVCLLSQFTGLAQTIIYSENFESTPSGGIPTGFVEAHTGGGHGWEAHEGPTRWGILNIERHSKYCLVDDANYFWNDIAALTTASFSLVGSTNPHLSFEYVYGEVAALEKAWVEISTNGGATYAVVDTIHTCSTWLTRIMDLSGFAPSANCKLRFCYKSPVGGGLSYIKGMLGIAIDNIKVYSPSAVDMGIYRMIPDNGTAKSFVKIGDSATFIGWIANYGTTSHSGFYIYSQVGSAPPMSQYFSTPCAPFTWNSFTLFSLPYVPATTGQQTIKVWIEVPGDTNHSNDTMSATITGVDPAHVPIKRVFIEELTGTWCGWCPRGIVYLDSIWHTDSAYTSITCVHSKFNYDGMANENLSTRLYDTFTNKTTLLGYPSCIYDRGDRLDMSSNSLYQIKQRKKLYPFSDIGVTHSIVGDKITAHATIKPATELIGDFRLELIVSEDGVTGTGFQFAQGNAYSGISTEMYGCGYNFNDSANIIPAGSIKFRFVARKTLPEDLFRNPNGIPGSLPTILHADSFYSYTFDAITIPSNWNPDRLRCIVMLIDNNPLSPNYGLVLNSATTSHPPLIGGPAAHLTDLTDPAIQLSLHPNPADKVVNVSFDLYESTVTDVCVYDMLGRMLIVKQALQMTGKQSVAINTSELAPGTYNVVLRSGMHRVSSLLIVQ
jgi:hypothetical protein